MTQTILISVVETPTFVRQAEKIWDDEEREAFVDHIARNPLAGDIIPGTGGVRKIRWSRKGTGKRGGARVIYFHHRLDMPLYLLMVYAKASREDMSPDEKQAATALTDALKKQHPSRKD
jgi:hypothetical protein